MSVGRLEVVSAALCVRGSPAGLFDFVYVLKQTAGHLTHLSADAKPIACEAPVDPSSQKGWQLKRPLRTLVALGEAESDTADCPAHPRFRLLLLPIS